MAFIESQFYSVFTQVLDVLKETVQMVNMKRLPNFFIPGAPKAGTTALYHYLKQHPQIYIPSLKELHFFNDDESFRQGVQAYIRRHFQGAETYPARGDATPAYLREGSEVAPRIASVYTDNPPKFVIILRDPVERAWSHYLHNVRLGIETESFERALILEKTRIRKKEEDRYGYFSDGLYARQIQLWLEFFDADRFIFVISEDLKNDTSSTLQSVFGHLDVDTSFRVDTEVRPNVASRPRIELFATLLGQPPAIVRLPFKLLLPKPTRRALKVFLQKLNSCPYDVKPQIDSRIAKMLRERYVSDIKLLEDVIARDLSAWLPQVP
jgi:hypothetical protein